MTENQVLTLVVLVVVFILGLWVTEGTHQDFVCGECDYRNSSAVKVFDHFTEKHLEDS